MLHINALALEFCLFLPNSLNLITKKFHFQGLTVKQNEGMNYGP